MGNNCSATIRNTTNILVYVARDIPDPSVTPPPPFELHPVPVGDSFTFTSLICENSHTYYLFDANQNYLNSNVTPDPTEADSRTNYLLVVTIDPITQLPVLNFVTSTTPPASSSQPMCITICKIKPCKKHRRCHH